MSILDKEWINFKNAIKTNNPLKLNINSKKKKEMPKCSDIYISTQTKIVYLNTSIDLNNVYWKIPITNYYLPKIGVLKKSIKINTINKDDISELEAKIDLYKRNGYKIFVTDLSKNKTKNTIQKKKI